MERSFEVGAGDGQGFALRSSNNRGVAYRWEFSVTMVGNPSAEECTVIF